MFKLGLTGGIGSGKTLVCSIFEKLGIPVYYADIKARHLMNSDEELRMGIVEMFGEEAYTTNGLNRAYLAQSVFGNPAKLAGLNTLVHPAVRMDFQRWGALHNMAPYLVEEAAILFESGAHKEMDLTALVYAPEALRIERVVHRDKVSSQDVLKRMDHQMGEEQLMKLAGHIIYNDGTKMLLPQVIDLHNTILNSIK